MTNALAVSIGHVFAAASVDNWIGLALAVGLTIYLILVLLFPERF